MRSIIASINDTTILLPIITQYQQLIIITDSTVRKKIGIRLKIFLQKHHPRVDLISFPAGENYKNNDTKLMIENKMLKRKYGKDSLILALGGGVVGDIAGFIASTYMRGIDYLQMPTTLLAMVDSSIGGKTAINTAYGKNLIGSIYAPIAVITDTTLLSSLPQKQIINGLIEAIKLFLTHNKVCFNDTKTYIKDIIKLNPRYLNNLIKNSIRIKTNIVKKDPFEKNERFLLNFGHTTAHALEKLTNYHLLHGYAVAYGILFESTISNLLGLLSNQALMLIINLLNKLGFQGNYLKKFSISEIINATKHDKKNRAGKVNYVLLKSIGKSYVKNKQYVHSVDDKIIKQAYHFLIQR